MNDIFTIISGIGVIIYFIVKYGESLARLNKIQKIGVLTSYILTAIITGFCIYYGSALLTEHFQNGFLKFIIRFTVVIITLWVAILMLNQILQKITKGIFPKITK